MKIIHDRRNGEYRRAGHPERPERILRSAQYLSEKHPPWSWHEPLPATREQLLRAHSAAHLDQVIDQRDDFDADCPAYPGIYQHAARAAGAALDAARSAMEGERTFSLMRPPGHHAMRERVMGFCYFNNIAVAALEAIARGVERLAIWDFDAHHGNGTEAVLAHHPQIVFASIHQFPGWPNSGTRSYANVHNYPVAPFTPRQEHMRSAEKALETLLAFRPQLLLISAGFDAYAGDPITQMSLERDDFATFGQWLRESALPGAAILEGGYSVELPELIDAFLTAWENSSTKKEQERETPLPDITHSRE